MAASAHELKASGAACGNGTHYTGKCPAGAPNNTTWVVDRANLLKVILMCVFVQTHTTPDFQEVLKGKFGVFLIYTGKKW